MSGLRRRPRVAALLRLAYRVAYRVLQAWGAVTDAETRGVKCVVRDEQGRALFVRHAYGDRSAWELPGGGVRRGEAPEHAVRREAAEELGVTDADWELVAVVDGVFHGRRENLSVFVAPWPGGAPRFDPVEIADAAWHPLDPPPAKVGPSTRLALRALGPTLG